jgi:hypothetical protein
MENTHQEGLTRQFFGGSMRDAKGAQNIYKTNELAKKRYEELKRKGTENSDRDKKGSDAWSKFGHIAKNVSPDVLERVNARRSISLSEEPNMEKPLSFIIFSEMLQSRFNI